ncbi:hypothetical protein D3C81_1484580 [compost metagenome]
MRESSTVTPEVRPICLSRSGRGSVMIMSLETIATVRSNCGKARAIQALIASTTRSAMTAPFGVCTVAGRPSSSPVIGVPSCSRTPSSRATRRIPRTSLPGCTLAAAGENQPSRCLLEPAMRCTSSSGRLLKELMPCFSSAAITPSVDPTCASLVAV